MFRFILFGLSLLIAVPASAQSFFGYVEFSGANRKKQATLGFDALLVECPRLRTKLDSIHTIHFSITQIGSGTAESDTQLRQAGATIVVEVTLTLKENIPNTPMHLIPPHLRTGGPAVISLHDSEGDAGAIFFDPLAQWLCEKPPSAEPVYMESSNIGFWLNFPD